MQRLLDLKNNNPREFARFGKFLAVGAVGFAVDFGSFNVMHALGVGAAIAVHLPIAQDYFTGHPEVIEQALSFTVATLSNFLWNYFWIYPEARASNPGRKLFQFIFVSLAGLVIGVPVFAGALFAFRALVAALGLNTLRFNLAGNLALMTRVGVLLFWNFFVNRKWTYGEVK
jgi:putative flippase GtrA